MFPQWVSTSQSTVRHCQELKMFGTRIVSSSRFVLTLLSSVAICLNAGVESLESLDASAGRRNAAAAATERCREIVWHSMPHSNEGRPQWPSLSTRTKQRNMKQKWLNYDFVPDSCLVRLFLSEEEQSTCTGELEVTLAILERLIEGNLAEARRGMEALAKSLEQEQEQQPRATAAKGGGSRGNRIRRQLELKHSIRQLKARTLSLIKVLEKARIRVIGMEMEINSAMKECLLSGGAAAGDTKLEMGVLEEGDKSLVSRFKGHTACARAKLEERGVLAGLYGFCSELKVQTSLQQLAANRLARRRDDSQVSNATAEPQKTIRSDHE